MRRHVTQLILLLCVAGWLSDTTTAIGQEGAIAEKDKLETFLMLASQMEANFEKIDTWSGVYDLSERLVTAGRRSDDGADTRSAWQVSEVVVSFAIDATTDRVRADFVQVKPAKLVDRVTGETIRRAFMTREYRTISTPEHLLYSLLYSSTASSGAQGPTQVVHRKASREARRNQFHVNPLTFFGNGNRRFSETCSMYARALQGELGEEFLTLVKNNATWAQREVDGATELFLTIRKFSDDGAVERNSRTMTFSSAAGFNAVAYWAISFGMPEVEMSWEYRKYGGVYLPSRFEMRRYAWANARDDEPWDPDENLILHRIFTLRESSLNQPVSPESFELAGLGLEYGDHVRDEIEGELRFYDGEKLVAAEEFKRDVPRPRK